MCNGKAGLATLHITHSTLHNLRGQYAMEVVVLFAAMSIAAILMATYIKQGMGAGVKSVEMQLNGAMRDNRP